MSKVTVNRVLVEGSFCPRVSVKVDDKEVFSFSYEMFDDVRYGPSILKLGPVLTDDEMFDEMISAFTNQYPDDETIVKDAFEQMREMWHKETERSSMEGILL